MQKIKQHIEALIATIIIPLMIILHGSTQLIIKYDLYLYLFFNSLLYVILITRTFRTSNIVLVKHIFTLSYSIVISQCVAVFIIENGIFLFALLISVIGGGILGAIISIFILVFRKLISNNIANSEQRERS